MDMLRGETMTASAPCDAARYDGMSIALHWVTALLVITQFLLAEFWGFFPRPTTHLMVVTHMSLGLILTGIYALRLVWRGTAGRQLPPAGLGVLDRVAKATHQALYALLGAELVLGFATRWTHNQALSFFGLLIPSPFGHISRQTGWLVGQAHDIVAWSIIVLAGCHAAAALLHHYVLKDGVLRRILPLG